MKISDVEDFQQEQFDNSQRGAGDDHFMDDGDYEDLNGEQQLERLANKYMLKSPAVIAMKRRSQQMQPSIDPSPLKNHLPATSGSLPPATNPLHPPDPLWQRPYPWD